MATPKKTAAKTRAPRATRSRAQLKDDFEDVAGEVEKDEEQDATAATAKRTRILAVKTATQGLTPEVAAQNILKAKLDAGRALDGVAEELLAKTEELKTVREAIDLETAELETLHGKEIVASSIKALVEEYQAREDELQKRIEELEHLHVDRAASLDKAFKEQEAERNKNWKREDSDYQYNLAIARKQKTDAFAEEDRLRKIANDEKQRLFDQAFTQREQTIASAEGELTTLRTRVAGFDKELSVAEGKGRGMAESAAKHQVALLEAQHNATVRILEGEKKALFEANTTLANNVTSISAQLKAANEHIQKISSDALQSASGQAALTALQQNAANGGPAGKPQRS